MDGILEKGVRGCNKCGFCQQVCPVYQVTKKEGDVARGRIRLVRLVCEGKYDWGKNREIAERINNCLLCKACVDNCPSGVPTDKLMIAAREKICKKNGLSPIQRFVYRQLMSYRGRIDFSIKLARCYQQSAVRKFVDKSGVLKLIPKLKDSEMMFRPAFESTGRINDELRDVPKPRFRVAYFLGCATRIFFERVAVDTIFVLQRMGCSVELPSVECCGGPHWCTGDFLEARRLAEKNIKLLDGKSYDFIVTDCGTCGAILKEYPDWFGEDLDLAQAAKRFSAKVKDLNEFIVNDLGMDIELKPVHQVVTYHDPCHLVRGQGISKDPRIIFKSIPELRFVEMKESGRCCGGAGSYSVTHAELSQQILKRKINNFLDTSADVLATSCPSCMLQLGFGMRKANLTARVMHPVQLLALALREN